MENAKAKNAESAYLKEPYIGMPIYLEDYDEEDFQNWSGRNPGTKPQPTPTAPPASSPASPAQPAAPTMETPDEMEDDTTESVENYCRSSSFEAWPIAMAYVPWQSFTEVYEPEATLQNGTVFPQLNLPFLGGGSR